MTIASQSNPTLNWVNIFARNLEDLPRFYSELFGLNEIEYMRNSVFCGYSTGASALGFLAPEVYDVLELEAYRDQSGAGFLLNFETHSVEEVDRLVGVAVTAGATLIKGPYETGYGWYQAVLTDPEDNIFRINKILEPREGP
ncbi:VOC family protein [Gordonia sp. NPDC003376]